MILLREAGNYTRIQCSFVNCYNTLIQDVFVSNMFECGNPFRYHPKSAFCVFSLFLNIFVVSLQIRMVGEVWIEIIYRSISYCVVLSLRGWERAI